MTDDWDADAESDDGDFDPGIDDDFDYDEYVREHHEGGTSTSLAPVWKATATVLLLMILFWFVMVIG